jgi:hypothetical protein
MSSATDLNLLDLGLTEVPEDIAQRSGNVVTSLNMTENALRLVFLMAFGPRSVPDGPPHSRSMIPAPEPRAHARGRCHTAK